VAVADSGTNHLIGRRVENVTIGSTDAGQDVVPSFLAKQSSLEIDSHGLPVATRPYLLVVAIAHMF
jgi:hypothetical protein